MNNPNSKPVLNMKRTPDIQYVSVIKPLPSISLFKYHEASHHPVCTLFHNPDTSFFTGSFSESLATCGKITSKQFSWLDSSWWQWAQWEWHWLNPKHCPCTAWAWMLGEYCFIFWPWLTDLWLVVCYWECCCQVSFLSPSLGAYHAFPCHLPLVEWLHLLALSCISF